MSERLDEERLELLRQWGVGLSAASRDELRAAGKAILLLIDEIEQLQVDLWNTRAGNRDLGGADSAAGLPGALQGRIAAAMSPDSEER